MAIVGSQYLQVSSFTYDLEVTISSLWTVLKSEWDNAHQVPGRVLNNSEFQTLFMLHFFNSKGKFIFKTFLKNSDINEIYIMKGNSSSYLNFSSSPSQGINSKLLSI